MVRIILGERGVERAFLLENGTWESMEKNTAKYDKNKRSREGKRKREKRRRKEKGSRKGEGEGRRIKGIKLRKGM